MPRYLVMPDPGAPDAGVQLTGMVIIAPDPQRAAVRYARRQTTPAIGPQSARDVLILPFPAGTKLRVGQAAWDAATPDAALVSDEVPDGDA